MITQILIDKLDKFDYRNMDFDTMLDRRDLPIFDDEWIRVYHEVELLKRKSNVYIDGNNDSDNIRKQTFLKTFKLTQDDEIAAYISDDFGLIYDSEMLGYHDEWLDRLINCYHSFQFPSGEL